MGHIKIGKLSSLLFAILVFISIFSFTCFGESAHKRVLLMSSKPYNEDDTSKVIASIEKNISNCTIEYQFIDFLPTESSISAFDNRMAYFFQNTTDFDLIIANGNSALKYVNNESQKYFPNTPVVFCNVDYNLGTDSIKSNPMLTGVLNVNSIKANISLIPTLFPNTKKIVAIMDSEQSIDYNNYITYQSTAANKNTNFSVIVTSKYTKMEIAEILSNLDRDTVLYFDSFNSDKNGNSYTLKEAFDFINQNCNLPIISNTNSLDYGNLGGLILSYDAIGDDTSKIANDVLNGKAPKDITPISNRDYDYAFNSQLLKKYNLSKALLPQDSVIVNRSMKLVSINKYPILTPILAGILLCGLLFICIRKLNFKTLKGEVTK